MLVQVRLKEDKRLRLTVVTTSVHKLPRVPETLRDLPPCRLPTAADLARYGSCPATVPPAASSAAWQRRLLMQRARPPHQRGAGLDSDDPGPRPAQRST